MGWTVPTPTQQPPPYSAIFPPAFPEVNPDGITEPQYQPPAASPNLSHYYPAQPAGVHVQYRYFPPPDGSTPLYYQPSPSSLPLPINAAAAGPSAIQLRDRRRIALIVCVSFTAFIFFVLPLSLGLTYSQA